MEMWAEWASSVTHIFRCFKRREYSCKRVVSAKAAKARVSEDADMKFKCLSNSLNVYLGRINVKPGIAVEFYS